jgi:AraC-like DNA-binding protein
MEPWTGARLVLAVLASGTVPRIQAGNHRRSGWYHFGLHFATAMQYREALPQPDLAPFVLCYWELTVPKSGESPREHNVFPDGCVALLYRRSVVMPETRLRIAGATLISRKVPVWPGDLFWGVRLQPAACQALIGCAPSTLRDKALEAAEVDANLANCIRPELDACSAFDQAIDVYARALRSLQRNPQDIDRDIAMAANAIARSGGAVKIAEVAAAAGIGVRQFERRFQRAVGLTPKQFARTRRMRATAVAVARAQNVNWAELAVETGFSDQPHLAHEMKTVTGRSPALFEKDVRKIKHGDLIE